MDKQRFTVVLMRPPRTPAAELRAKQGAKIREFRKFRNLSQLQIATEVGVTKAAVSEWERGASSPRQIHQLALAKALQCPWTVLFGLENGVAA